MPPFKPRALWEMSPHTRAKLAIVDRYLYSWFQIFGRNGGIKRLVYIDGFAGPGEYTNFSKGSPVVAIVSAVKVLADPAPAIQSKELRFYFIEKEPWAAEHLRQKLSHRPLASQIQWDVKQGTFDQHLPDILANSRGSDQPVPIFAFVDPFGATGVPFEAVANILSSPNCEILLNLDSDGIARVMAASANPKNAQHLNSLFGDDGWRVIQQKGGSIQQVSVGILQTYKERLRSLPNVKYVFAFTMNDSPGKLNYHLVFASQHARGLEKMKEAMKTIDQSGDYTFSDTSVDQTVLQFAFNAPESFSQKLHATFLGQIVPLEQVRDYVLNETPFTNPAPVLEPLRKDSLISLDCFGEPPRHGYPPERVRAIRFLPPASGAKPPANQGVLF